MIENIKNYKIILASQSPRRQELLKQLNIPFELKIKEDVEEVFSEDMPINEVPEFLAKLKAKPFEQDLKNNSYLVITADTVVVCNNQILGKPANKKNAYEMLQMLSGTTHEVITGVALTSNSKQKSFTSSTKVTFKTLTDNEINYYIDHYQPYDKAGSYGIQEWIGMIGIEHIEGSYFNVVGMPIQKLYTELQNY